MVCVVGAGTSTVRSVGAGISVAGWSAGAGDTGGNAVNGRGSGGGTAERTVTGGWVSASRDTFAGLAGGCRIGPSVVGSGTVTGSGIGAGLAGGWTTGDCDAGDAVDNRDPGAGVVAGAGGGGVTSGRLIGGSVVRGELDLRWTARIGASGGVTVAARWTVAGTPAKSGTAARSTVVGVPGVPGAAVEMGAAAGIGAAVGITVVGAPGAAAGRTGGTVDTTVVGARPGEAKGGFVACEERGKSPRSGGAELGARSGIGAAGCPAGELNPTDGAGAPTARWTTGSAGGEPVPAEKNGGGK